MSGSPQRDAKSDNQSPSPSKSAEQGASEPTKTVKKQSEIPLPRGLKYPSENYKKNQETFAYSLSYSVFGSLLASYVLGFVGFVFAYLQPDKKFVVNARQPLIKSTQNGQPSEEVQTDFLSKLMNGNFDAAELRRIFNERIVLDINNSNISNSPLFVSELTFDLIVIISVFLIISVTYSIVTALYYFNYHRIIMHVGQNRASSIWDFIISLSIGALFGLSLILPLASVFFLGCLFSLSLLRKRVLIRKYASTIAHKIYAVTDAATTDAETDDELHTVQNVSEENQKKVLSTFSISENRIIKTWVAQEKYSVYVGVAVMMLFPTAIFFLLKKGLFDVPSTVQMMINTVALILLCLWFVRALKSASAQMPASGTKEQEDLDKAFFSAIEELKSKKTKPEGAAK
jgi:hypothetical protein